MVFDTYKNQTTAHFVHSLVLDQNSMFFNSNLQVRNGHRKVCMPGPRLQVAY